MKTRRIAKSSEAGTGVKGLETASFWNWEVSSAPYRRVLSFLLENLNVSGKKGNFGSIRKQNRSRRAADGGSGEIDGRKWRTGFFAGRMEWSSKKVGGEVKG